jgi:hypothetical protein
MFNCDCLFSFSTAEKDILGCYYYYYYYYYLDALFLINVFKNKISFLPYLILLAYVYPLEVLETFLPSWLTTISRSALQLDVFPLLMLCARKFTFLTRTKLRLLISLNFTYTC